MKKSILLNSFLVLLFLLNSVGIQDVSGTVTEPETEQAWEASPASSAGPMSVTLSTPTQKMITFNTDEQASLPASESREIPHLVLKRNGILTPGYERTLELAANNVPVYAPGIFVELTITTQHKDPDFEGTGQEIQVWTEKQFVPYTALTQQGVRINFSNTFQRLTELENRLVLTPTDYYKYQISIVDLNGNLRQSYTEDFAFLIENQWRAPLPPLLESEPGAAPDELLVYFFDMVPFQSDFRDPTSQIPREDVERYVQTELIPAMVQAIKTQSNAWEFAWYPEWRNFRRDEDPKTLSVALGEYGTWFHGVAPSLGHSMISIRVDGSVGEYDSLTDGLMSIFHHELFHNHQRSIALHFSNHANIAGQDEAWQIFSEGTAVLASSVGQPKIQFEQVSVGRSYTKRANAFIGSEGVFGGGLNKSYRKIPYHTAIYWRFLYEKCGGLSNGEENPAEGMKVIRSVLETLYKGELADSNTSVDSVESLPVIMDAALAGTQSCPFHNYRESLSQFAKAIYTLRLQNGKCLAPGYPTECGFYDPNNLYTTPALESLDIAENSVAYFNGSIRSSYGIDLVEIQLDANKSGGSLTVAFDKASDSEAEFMIEMVKIKMSGFDVDESQTLSQVDETVLVDTKDGQAVIEIDSIDINRFDRLGLVIIRTDPKETLDEIGSYTIRVINQQ